MSKDRLSKLKPFPKRAVVTGGMPYGNKPLHFGHIGGVFVHADIFSRFLRDRIGGENVMFVSGIDCYGSMVDIDYHKRVEAEDYTGTIEDFLREIFAVQKRTLDKYGVGIDLYAASALGVSGEEHKQVSNEVFDALYNSGYLKLLSTKQFYDPEKGEFLNGRQVTGRCPIQGCKSEKAYANECALGHQYNESDLIAPVSALTGLRPELRETRNWYFDLEAFKPLLKEYTASLEGREDCRQGIIPILNEFLKDPVIYIKRELLDEIKPLCEQAVGLPEYEVVEEENKPSVQLVFKKLDDREAFCALLDEHSIRYRTGKTLVPFRISGNAGWGVPVPARDGVDGLTFWVWPESLWAPISFSRACLKLKAAMRESGEQINSITTAQKNISGCDVMSYPADWESWWCSEDAGVYQFIGEDNIYFYALAEMALFMAMNTGGTAKPVSNPPDGKFQLPNIIANRHLLYNRKKASSSGELKPPTGEEMLDYYTAEQLRMHFFALNMSATSANFEPAAFLSKSDAIDGGKGDNLASSKGDTFDKTLKEGNLLTNVFNRLVRSCFYTCQKYFGGAIPSPTAGWAVSDEVRRVSDEMIYDYDRYMYSYEFSKLMEALELYIRWASKLWSDKSKAAGDDLKLNASLLADSFHCVRVLATLLHPMAPEGCEMIREYLGVDERLWSWQHIFEGLDFFTGESHKFKFLEPRVDFFKKHESQLK